MPILKGPHTWTPKRDAKAREDLERLGQLPIGRPQAASTPAAYGMPNRHCPGTLALGMLGGRVISQLDPREIMK